MATFEKFEIKRPVVVSTSESKKDPEYLWRDISVERKELSHLLKAWSEVLYEKKPKSVVLMANTGFGKTRLIQNFYEKIFEAGNIQDPYYPKKLDYNSLAINPSDSEINYDSETTCLWWGVRIPDQTDQKSECTSSFSAEPKTQLIRHVTAELHKEGGPNKSALIKSIKGVGDVALTLVEGLSGVDTAKGVYEGSKEVLINLNKIFNDVRVNTNAKLSEEENKLKLDDKEFVINLISEYMSVTKRKKPIVWLIDDGQWIDCDPVLLEVLDAVMEEALKEDWPILFLITHWEDEWHALERQGKGIPSIIKKWSWHERSEIIKLGLFDLSPILDKALPNISQEQRKRIIGSIDNGKQKENNALYDNPRCLDEFLKEIYDAKNIYLRGSINNPLVENWEEIFIKQKGALNCAQLAKDRFRGFNSELKNLLAWSSYNGIDFPEKLVEAISKVAKYQQCDWNTCSAVEGFISRDIASEKIISAFQDSKYKNIANNFLDEDNSELIIKKTDLKEIVEGLLGNYLTINKFFEDDAIELKLTRSEEVLINKIAIRLFSETTNLGMKLRALIKSMNLVDSKNSYNEVVASIDKLCNEVVTDANSEDLFLGSAVGIWSKTNASRSLIQGNERTLEGIVDMHFVKSGFTIFCKECSKKINNRTIRADSIVEHESLSDNRFVIEMKYLRHIDSFENYLKTPHAKQIMRQINLYKEHFGAEVIIYLITESTNNETLRHSEVYLYSTLTEKWSKADSPQCEKDAFGVSDFSLGFSSIYKTDISYLIQMLIAAYRYKAH